MKNLPNGAGLWVGSISGASQVMRPDIPMPGSDIHFHRGHPVMLSLLHVAGMEPRSSVCEASIYDSYTNTPTIPTSPIRGVCVCVGGQHYAWKGL